MYTASDSITVSYTLLGPSAAGTTSSPSLSSTSPKSTQQSPSPSQQQQYLQHPYQNQYSTNNGASSTGSSQQQQLQQLQHQPQQRQQDIGQPQQLQQLQQQLPIANAGVSKTVAENTLVTLDGRASYSTHNSDGAISGGGSSGTIIVAYQWTQLPMGVPVVLSNANSATPTFTAPTVSKDTTVAFSLRVMDNHGMVSTNPALVYIMIKHTQQQQHSSLQSQSFVAPSRIR